MVQFCSSQRSGYRLLVLSEPSAVFLCLFKVGRMQGRHLVHLYLLRKTQKFLRRKGAEVLKRFPGSGVKSMQYLELIHTRMKYLVLV